jgi:hypothetical protein
MSVSLLFGVLFVVLFLLVGAVAVVGMVVYLFRRGRATRLLVICPKCGDQTDAQLANCRFCGERIQ